MHNADVEVVEAGSQETLIAELETAVRIGSSEARVKKLREVVYPSSFPKPRHHDRGTDRRVRRRAVPPDEQGSRTRALVERPYHNLAPVDNAPVETIRKLAWNEEIEVVGPSADRFEAPDDQRISPRLRGSAGKIALLGGDLQAQTPRNARHRRATGTRRGKSVPQSRGPSRRRALLRQRLCRPGRQGRRRRRSSPKRSGSRLRRAAEACSANCWRARPTRFAPSCSPLLAAGAATSRLMEILSSGSQKP